ncbi:hypothetical protein HRI_004902200 [Hibiscus trionum]|uniref:SWIM-type domain-containing protein n=1 Tax=Hibiscus trionum TaxID=183268 RepID=A0A9W7JEL3_HIBTR|nr:hypothetical protein HRI_004902200 [Hibiscus trionum]
MKMYWQVSENPFEVKALASDNDVLEMLSKLPRNHYVHIYLEEVRPYQSNAASVEPEMNADSNSEVRVDFSEKPSDDHNVDENIGEPETNDNLSVSSEIRVDSNSDSEDIDYEVEKSTTYESGFSDSEDDLEDDIVSKGVGDNMTQEGSHKPNVEGSDEVRVDSEPDSVNSESFHSLDESDSDGQHKKPRYHEFNTTVDISNPIFKVGLLFATKQVLRESIKMYSIKNRYTVKLKRNDNRRIQAVCKAGCPWNLWASPINFKEPNETWQIKSLIGEHRCLKEYKNSNMTAKFIANQYLDKFHTDPNYSSKSLKQDVFRDYNISVHLSKCIRAKNLALEKLHGDIKGQYTRLYDYLGELRSSNPGTTTVLKLDEGVFERLYICMQAMKDGFKGGCRPIICLDGCHLKGHYGGQLLSAVGMDAEDNLYPISFTIVEAETESSWCWFMEILKTDLELNNSHHLTFMTDKQKGLMESVAELFPHVDHRTCVRHLYNNFKLHEQHKGKALKDQLWRAARATYVREFEAAMETLKGLSSAGHTWLSGKDPTMWSKSHFSFKAKSDILLNNHCECFNKMIIEARDKPIITLVESIRSKLMQRIAKKRDEAEKLTGPLCPKIQKKLDNAFLLSQRCWPVRAGGAMYQVSCGPQDQHSINMQTETCSCRRWQLTGIPCIHAISVILMLEDRPEKFVAPCYSVSTQMSIYSHFINPVRGENQWSSEETQLSVLPPILRRPPGRPHKNHRRRE